MKITRYKEVWELWEMYNGELESYILKNTRSLEVTKDIVHEVLLKTHKSCCSNIEIKNIRSWLFQIAYNTTMDFHKSKKKNNRLRHLDHDEVTVDVYQELAIFIDPLINFLPDKYAVPLRLADIDGIKQKDVATQLSLSLTATKSRIQRGRKLLKEEINTCFTVNDCCSKGLLGFDLKEDCTPLQKFVNN